MIRRNPWSRWQAINPAPALMVGLVVSRDTGAGTSVVQIPPITGGSLVRVLGAEVEPGSRAYVRDGRIEGQAPSLALVEVEV